MLSSKQCISPDIVRRLYYMAFLLTAVLTLTVILYAMLRLWTYPYDGLTWSSRTGLVYSVDPAGPAHQVGVRWGDRVVAVDRVPASEVSLLYGEKGQKDVVSLTLLRGDQKITVSFPLASPSWLERVLRLEPLFIALVFWSTATVVWMLQHSHRVSQLFFLVSQAAASLLAVGDLTVTQLHWAITLFRLLLLAVAPLALHFFTFFPQEMFSPHIRHYLLRGFYGGAGLLGVLTLLHDTIPSAFPLRTARDVFVIVTLLAGLALLFRSGQGASLQVHQRRRLLVTGMICSLLPLLLLSFLPQALRGWPLVGYVWTFPLLVLLPLAYGYAVRAGELGTADWVLSRTLAHLMLTSIFLGFYVLLFWTLDHALARVTRARSIVAAVFAVGVAAFFAPLRNLLLKWADYLFYGGWYDYRAVLHEMSQALAGIIEARELAELLVHRLARTLRLRGAALLLPTGEETVSLVEATGWAPSELPTSPLPHTGALARALCQAACPLAPTRLHAALANVPLTNTERSWLSCPDLELWVPLVRREKLQGILLLGARAGGEHIDAQDRRLLATLAWNAATAAENVQLFEALRRRADEVNQLYSQLAQAREEERKYVARELHDQVVQDLINVYHYLDVDGPCLAPTPDKHTEALRGRVLTLVQALRRICTELRPPALDDLGLGLAVERHVEDVAEETGLNISLWVPTNCYETLVDLPEEISVCLFRALQEALTNVYRHAQATQVHVGLTVDEGHITLEVRDNGCGFRCPIRLGALIHDGHFGLAGLQERLALIGGTLQVESIPGRGTILVARAPWKEALRTEERKGRSA